MPPMVSAVQPSANVCCSRERAEGFQTRTIDIGQEATQTGAMRKTSASKERHEGCLERLYSLKEVGKSPFPADGIADQQREKIDGFIRSEAPAHQAHLMGKGFKHPFLLQIASNDDHFSKSRGHRESVFRGGLDLNTRGGYHTKRDLLLGK